LARRQLKPTFNSTGIAASSSFHPDKSYTYQISAQNVQFDLVSKDDDQSQDGIIDEEEDEESQIELEEAPIYAAGRTVLEKLFTTTLFVLKYYYLKGGI
jgi:hypothetical protein